MLQPKVLRLEDYDNIVNFEKARAAALIPDETERELLSWHASWRKESLDHYLALGWSFGLWRQPTAEQQTEQLAGYFIAQPQLFVRGLTQTLWVERLVADSPQATSDLVDIAYRISREKHLQKVCFYLHDDAPLASSVLQLQKVEPDYVEIKTTRY